MTVKREKKLSKRLKERCKKLGIRITVKKQGKRVYKTTKTLLQECKKKLKRKFKKKRKIKRKRKFGQIQYQTLENRITDYINNLTDFIPNQMTYGLANFIPNQTMNVRDANYVRLRNVIRTVVLPHPDQIMYTFVGNPGGNPGGNNNLTPVQQQARIEFIKICIIMAILNDEQTIKAIDILKDNPSDASPNGITGIRDILENTYGNTFSVESLIDKRNHYRRRNNIGQIIMNIQGQGQAFRNENNPINLINTIVNNIPDLIPFIFQDFTHFYINGVDNSSRWSTRWLKSFLQSTPVKKLILGQNNIQNSDSFANNSLTDNSNPRLTFTTINGGQLAQCFQPRCYSTLDGNLTHRMNIFHRFLTCTECNRHLVLINNNQRIRLNNIGNISNDPNNPNYINNIRVRLNHFLTFNPPPGLQPQNQPLFNYNIPPLRNNQVAPQDLPHELEQYTNNNNIINNRYNLLNFTTKRAEDMVKELHSLHRDPQGTQGHPFSINLFSLLDGSSGGDTPSLNIDRVTYIHDNLYGQNNVIRNYYPNNFQNENPFTKILTLENSDFLYSLKANANQNRAPFFLRVGNEFRICSAPGLEGKNLILADANSLNPIQIRGNGIPWILTDLVQRNGHPYRDWVGDFSFSPYNVRSMNRLLRGKDGIVKRFESTPNAGLQQTEYSFDRHLYDQEWAGGDANFFVFAGAPYQRVFPFELVLPDQLVNRWVCLKVNGSRIKFERSLLGYLNNYSVNNIQQPNTNHDHINYDFGTPREPTDPAPIPNQRPADNLRQWGFVKINLQNQRRGRTNIPNQFIFQKSTQSYLALVWYYPHNNVEVMPKFMIISNNLPIKGFINKFIYIQEHNILNNDYTLHNQVCSSVMNYKRLLDPAQYFGLRQHLMDQGVERNGQFITQDFMCFIQANYVHSQLNDRDINIDIYWQRNQNPNNIQLVTKRNNNNNNNNFGTNRQQKDVETLIEEIKKELDIVNYYDFILTLNNNKVIILHFINPYVLEKYHDNLLVKENMDTILKKLRCTSFKVQTQILKHQNEATPFKGPRPKRLKRNILGKRTLFKELKKKERKKVQSSIRDYLIRQRNRSGSGSSTSSDNTDFKRIKVDTIRPRSFSNISNISAASDDTVINYPSGIVSGTIDKLRDVNLSSIPEEVIMTIDNERQFGKRVKKKRKKKKVRSKKKSIKKKVKKKKVRSKKKVKKKKVRSKKKVKKKRKVKKRK